MDLDRLYQSIVQGLWRERGTCESRKSLEERLFQKIAALQWSADEVFHQFEELSHQFCDFRNRHEELKEERRAQLKAFSDLFANIPMTKKIEQLMAAPMSVQEL